MNSDPSVVIRLDRLTIVMGDIAAVAADVIINAASHFLMDAGGVSSAIFRAAGPQLRKECLSLGACDEGQAKITDAFDLPARHIIHAVPPIWRGGYDDEDKRLALCYRSCFELMERHGHRSAAFPSLGTGGHGYPVERAAGIAIQQIVEFLKRSEAIEEIIVVCFDEETWNAYTAAVREIDAAKDLIPTERIEVRSTFIELVRIVPGVFEMGSVNEWFDEAPAHQVRISRPFLLSKYPITQAVWESVVGRNPSEFQKSGEYPVETISWDDAICFCEKLSIICGRPVRLPSEAEWEYACRAGTDTEFFMFSDPAIIADGSNIPTALSVLLCDFAWFDLNSRGTTHPVGHKLPNPWGLHDIIGNVWEWCQDAWHGGYTGAPADECAWSVSGEAQTRRCLRGGAWDMDSFRCRSTYRSYDHKSRATSRFGVRIAVDV